MSDFLSRAQQDNYLRIGRSFDWIGSRKAGEGESIIRMVFQNKNLRNEELTAFAKQLESSLLQSGYKIMEKGIIPDSSYTDAEGEKFTESSVWFRTSNKDHEAIIDRITNIFGTVKSVLR